MHTTSRYALHHVTYLRQLRNFVLSNRTILAFCDDVRFLSTSDLNWWIRYEILATFYQRTRCTPTWDAAMTLKSIQSLIAQNLQCICLGYGDADDHFIKDDVDTDISICWKGRTESAQVRDHLQLKYSPIASRVCYGLCQVTSGTK